MAVKTDAIPEQVLSPLTCRHHWLIESPTGPVSRGVCQRCGEVREFNNTAQDNEWQVGVFPDLASGDWEDVKVPSLTDEEE